MSVELPMFDGGSEAEGAASRPRGVPIPTHGPGGRFNLLNLVVIGTLVIRRPPMRLAPALS